MTVVTVAPSASSGSWTNPSNVYSDDSNFATSATNGQQMVAYGYSFSIPSGATIQTVEVGVKAKCATNDYLSVAISKDGGSDYGSATNQSLTTTDTQYWVNVTSTRTGWTDSDFNTSNNIRVRVTQIKSGSADTVSLNYLPVRVTYVVVTTYTTTKNSDANLKGTLTTTKNSNADLKGTISTLTKNSDARLLKTYDNITKTSNATLTLPVIYANGKLDELYIYSTNLSQSDVDALYNKFVTPTYTVTKNSDARLRKTYDTTTKTSDARLRKTYDNITKNSDARLRKTYDTLTKNSNANLKGTLTTTKNSDARLRKTYDTTTKTSDARLRKTYDTLTKNSDARLRKTYDTLTKNSNANLKGTLTTTKNSDARFKATKVVLRVTTDHQETSGGYFQTGWVYRIGQKKTVSGTVSSIGFSIKRSSTISGNVYARIRKVSDDTILAEQSMLASDVPTSYTWIDFTFPTPVAINESVYILIEHPEAVFGTKMLYVSSTNPSVKPNEFAVTYDSAYEESLFTDYDLAYHLYYLSPIYSDANLKGTLSTTKNSDARLKKTIDTLTKTSDARLAAAGVTTYTFTKNSDSSLKKPDNTFTKNSNANLKKYGIEFTKTSDARLLIVRTTTKNSDANLKGTLSTTKNSDARLRKTYESTKNSNANLKGTLTLTKNSDARLFKIGTLTITKNSDANLKGTLSVTKTSDARLITLNTYTFTKNSDANLKKYGIEFTKTSDGRLLIVRTTTKNSDANLKKSDNLITKYSNANLKILAIILTKQSDARLLKTQTVTKTSDARLLKTQSLTKNSDASLKKTLTLTATSDATLYQSSGVRVQMIIIG